MPTDHILGALAPIACALLTGSAAAQCPTGWQPGLGVPGVDGSVWTTHWWDPDGSGPAQGKLVVGGAFGCAGTVATANIAVYDPATNGWSALGQGVGTVHTSESVRALATLPNGDLVAAGRFSSPGLRIARWDGTSWSPLGAGLPGSTGLEAARALAVLPNGDLVAGGEFTDHLSRWDGTAWHPWSERLSAAVHALAVMPNGDLIVGGRVAVIGSSFVNGVARWNGTSWTGLAGGVAGGNMSVDALAVLPTGDLVAAGSFLRAGGVPAIGIARWDGTRWQELGTRGSSYPAALAVAANGELIVGGQLTVGSTDFRGTARWDGTSWSGFRNGVQGAVAAVAVAPGGEVYFGGSIARAGGVGLANVAQWTGTSWSRLGGGGFDAPVSTLLVRADGDVFAGGSFRVAGHSVAESFALETGGQWSAIAGAPRGTVNAAAERADGSLLFAGEFLNSNSVLMSWDGTVWQDLASASRTQGLDVVVADDGDVFLGGSFDRVGGIQASLVARHDGTGWSALGGGLRGPAARCEALALAPSGDLVAGGTFTTAGTVAANNVARWNGTQWFAMGSGAPGPVHALAVLADGRVLAAGALWNGSINVGFVQVWDGTQWQTLGTTTDGGSGFGSTVDALLTLPDGGLIAAGRFATLGGTSASNAARWDGLVWSPFGAGLDGIGWRNGVRTLAWSPTGEVLFGGDFTTAGGATSAHFARLRTPCPASATDYAPGCSGNAGPVALSAGDGPWIGAVFESTTVGFVPGGLGAAVFGATPSATPLVNLHPAGGAGCVLAASPDVVLALAPVSGIAVLQLAIPQDLQLVGVQLRQQTLTLELQGPQLGGLFASNAMLVTIGAF